ncbi:hypothetical protein GcM1_187004 [Golovinomyces cichoracearum]|uniref:Uncharacterized protein n=1 Tax=Golovinomyces cichoracearum TaxID=62708 RepID=A0A420J2I5_9PEZI|nr:hypothetical protein GcM1_187004 [Golovinomyces cichoracearum]
MSYTHRPKTRVQKFTSMYEYCSISGDRIHHGHRIAKEQKANGQSQNLSNTCPVPSISPWIFHASYIGLNR